MTPENTVQLRKQELRAAIKPALRLLNADVASSEVAANHAQEIVARAGALVPDRATVLLYAHAPQLGEPDLSKLAAALQARGCTLAALRVDWFTRTMTPVHIRCWPADLVPDPESPGHTLRMPVPDAPPLPLAQIDIVFLPGVAFDRSGHRLGRGGGFYDRFLANLRAQRRDALIVGVCFASQLITAVPVEPHDQVMDVVVTPEETIRRIS